MTHKALKRCAALALLLPVLAACDDEGGTGPDLLTRDEVAGFYRICTLAFAPTGALQPVDIPAAAFELANPQVQQPRLTVDPDGTFELEYTPRGQFSDRELPGTFQPASATSVTLNFTAAGSEVGGLLLPTRLTANFQDGPKTLTVTDAAEYEVPRADYARLRGVSESGLADRIPGRLSARFVQGDC